MTLPLKRITSLILFGCTWLAAGAPALAGRLNDTAQLTCLDANAQWTTACAGSPQDAGHGRDQTHPSTKDGLAGFAYRRVCNNGEDAGSGSCPALPSYGMGATEWGCTRDKVSGLLWELKDAVDTSSRRSLYGSYPTQSGYWSSPVNGMLVSDYVAWANANALCGRSDWRLPTVQEITSILRFGGADASNAVPPADTTMGFPDLQRLDVDRSYITTAFDGSLDANGNLPYAFMGATGWAASPMIGDGVNVTGVRLVAGDSSRPRFWVQGRLGEELLDRSTGLVWQRCRLGMRWTGKACKGTPSQLSWRDALSAATAEGWRLPNVKELMSLVTQTGTGPRLPARFFPGLQGQPGSVWTATHAGETDYGDGSRTILARQVGLVGGLHWWAGSPGDALNQVLLVKDR